MIRQESLKTAWEKPEVFPGARGRGWKLVARELLKVRLKTLL
jgi:hypothetical protein